MRLLLLLPLLLAACAGDPVPAPPVTPTAVRDTMPDRTVAVTFDDLPATAAAGGKCDGAGLTDLTERLLAQVAEHDVPATGLVVESRICDELRTELLPDLLTRWLDAGHTLGNHTFSHPDLNTTPLADYQRDILRGEATTRRLLEARGQQLRYFRHPLLHAGDTPAKKAGLEAFLAEHGYTVAPVTIDNGEWIFAHAYVLAKQRSETEVMERLGQEYVTWMEEVVVHFEQWSRDLLGYEPPQVLLLHANELNADHFGALAAMLGRRGYRFVSLDEALADPVYDRPDPYVGPRGLSWLHRWALGEGREPRMEPDAPAWVVELRDRYQGG